MKTQRFLIATEGNFAGRTISAEEICAMGKNFISAGVTVPVVYEFFEWSPVLSEVVSVAVDSDGEKMCLYVEVNVTGELQEVIERKVDHFLVPAILAVNNDAVSATLVRVGVTKNPIIPGLEKLQFTEANHPHGAFCVRVPTTSI